MHTHPPQYTSSPPSIPFHSLVLYINNKNGLVVFLDSKYTHKRGGTREELQTMYRYSTNTTLSTL